MRTGLIGGAVFAVLWFCSGWLPYLLMTAGGKLATLTYFVPSPLRRGVFGNPPLWAVIVQLLMALVLVIGFAVLLSLLTRGRAVFAPAWLAAILTAFGIGAALDLGNFLVGALAYGPRGAIGTMGAAADTTWWAVVAGWIPALVCARVGAGRAADPAAPSAGRGARRTLTLLALIAVFALVLLPFAAQAGANAAQEQLRAEQTQAEAEADPSGAAAPDPSAPGEPVPTKAPSEGSTADGACTAENTTILAPAPDGATGHRGQGLSLVNVSQEPCTVEGYPDVAYGDQNGHLLDVTVEHGSSFMAQDTGASPITLQPGDAASAVIGWDANSVHGQLAARSVWIAVVPGQERLSWEMPLDIIPGATVSVTAWAAEGPPAG